MTRHRFCAVCMILGAWLGLSYSAQAQPVPTPPSTGDLYFDLLLWALQGTGFVGPVFVGAVVLYQIAKAVAAMGQGFVALAGNLKDLRLTLRHEHILLRADSPIQPEEGDTTELLELAELAAEAARKMRGEHTDERVAARSAIAALRSALEKKTA